MDKIQLLLWAISEGKESTSPQTFIEMLRLADRAKANQFTQLKLIDLLNKITIQDLFLMASITDKK